MVGLLDHACQSQAFQTYFEQELGISQVSPGTPVLYSALLIEGDETPQLTDATAALGVQM